MSTTQKNKGKAHKRGHAMDNDVASLIASNSFAPRGSQALNSIDPDILDKILATHVVAGTNLPAMEYLKAKMSGRQEKGTRKGKRPDRTSFSPFRPPNEQSVPMTSQSRGTPSPLYLPPPVQSVGESSRAATNRQAPVQPLPPPVHTGGDSSKGMVNRQVPVRPLPPPVQSDGESSKAAANRQIPARPLPPPVQSGGESSKAAANRQDPARPVSHTNSLTWINPRESANWRQSTRDNGPQHSSSTWTRPGGDVEREWAKIDCDLRRMELNPRSPFVPRTFSEYLIHREGRSEDAREEQIRRLRAAEALNFDRARNRYTKILPAFRGKVFNNGRGAVLGFPTMWTASYEPMEGRPQADWPCKEEMKEEGDERYTSGFKRFPALPRVPDLYCQGLHWKQRHVLKALPFDAVWAPPTAESLADTGRYDEAEVKEMEELVGPSLMAALNCESEPSVQSMVGKEATK